MYDIREGLTPKRLALTMWDFSWLNCRHGGGSFEDYHRVTDELLERGFNAVRIDCFPQIIGELEGEDAEITVKADPLANWGHSPSDMKHKIIKELLEFLGICKAKRIYVILSTWNSGCVEITKERVKQNPLERYLDNWEKTLNILKEKNLLDIVAYVDLDQEFPYFSPRANELSLLGGKADWPGGDFAAAVRPPGEMAPNGVRLRWNTAQLGYVRKLMDTSISRMQRVFPELRFTYSLTSFWNEVRATGIKALDVIEIHPFISGNFSGCRFENRTLFGSLTKDRGEHDYSDYQDRVNKTFKAIRPMLLGEIYNQLEFARDWGKEISAPIVNTESWGPWWHMDHKDLDWLWLKEWCAECNALAAEYGLWGSTPWNYGHPYWDNWKDVKWYREVNDIFLKG